MSLWDQLFSHMRQPVAQILLTRTDIADRTHWQNAKNTLTTLLDMGVVPVVNENDTLSVTEIKFGDNDTLSAIAAGMVHADYLFLMTDVDCLYDKNPRQNPDAKPIEVVRDIAELDADVSSRGSALGTGGMGTKIVAARLATSAGVTTVITRSSKPGNIRSIIKYVEAQKVLEQQAQGQGRTRSLTNSGTLTPTHAAALSNSLASLPDIQDPPTSLPADALPTEQSSPMPEATFVPPLHTRFVPDPHPIRDRYFWLLHGLRPHGKIFIDEGAHRALSEKAGLLPVGVVDVSGTFAQQEAVSLYVVKRIGGRRPKHERTTSKNAFPLSNSMDDLEGSSSPQRPSSHTPLYEGEPVEVGRALVNYAAAEIKRILGLHASEIANVLGYADSEYVALRENIAFHRIERSRPVSPAVDDVRNGVAGATLAGFAGVSDGILTPRTP
jgi:glutamate 5-kinase